MEKQKNRYFIFITATVFVVTVITCIIFWTGNLGSKKSSLTLISNTVETPLQQNAVNTKPASTTNSQEGKIVVEQGVIVENVKKISAPSYLHFIKSKGSENHYMKVMYSGDFCTYQQPNAWNLEKGQQIEVSGQILSDGTISTCESKDFYIKPIIDSATP